MRDYLTGPHAHKTAPRHWCCAPGCGRHEPFRACGGACATHFQASGAAWSS